MFFTYENNFSSLERENSSFRKFNDDKMPKNKTSEVEVGSSLLNKTYTTTKYSTLFQTEGGKTFKKNLKEDLGEATQLQTQRTR